MPKRVFLCYRRQDAAFAAGRITDYLTPVLGADAMFRYVDHGAIRFEDVSQQVLDSDVVLIVIGDRWLAPDASGRRRIDASDDFLRVELEYAFARHVPVIPVL